MTMLERVKSFRNEYFNSVIQEQTDRKKAPENYGLNRAVRAYLNTNDLGAETFLIDDMHFMQDMNEFMAAIERAGIREFLLCDTSTALMESLCYLMEHGWRVAGNFKLETSPCSAKIGLRMERV